MNSHELAALLLSKSPRAVTVSEGTFGPMGSAQDGRAFIVKIDPRCSCDDEELDDVAGCPSHDPKLQPPKNTGRADYGIPAEATPFTGRDAAQMFAPLDHVELTIAVATAPCGDCLHCDGRGWIMVPPVGNVAEYRTACPTCTPAQT